MAAAPSLTYYKVGSYRLVVVVVVVMVVLLLYQGVGRTFLPAQR
jgi:hypothetical protein